MITNFADITQELNDYELTLVQPIINGMKTKTKKHPIKAPEIIKKMTALGYKITEPRLRKICNHIRSKALLPIIGTSRGYYVSWDREEIAGQIKSLRERAASINQCADGLVKFMK